MRGGRIYSHTVNFLSAVYVVIGVVILALTLSRGGGPASIGVLMGVAFIAIGIGRALLQRRIGGRP